MTTLTQSQLSWLRRLMDYKWQAIPEQPLAALVRQGLAEQRADGLIRITKFGVHTVRHPKSVVKPKLVRQPATTATTSGNRLYYWAYGSNLCARAMRRRCPGARQFQALSLPDGALVFRGVADAVWSKGSTIHGGLWQITREHERELDRYEGVASRLYDKCYLRLLINGEEVRALYYQMRLEGIMPPSQEYLDTIAEGYRDFGLPLAALDQALEEAWGNKNPTEQLLARQARRGGRLAKFCSGSNGM